MVLAMLEGLFTNLSIKCGKQQVKQVLSQYALMQSPQISDIASVRPIGLGQKSTLLRSNFLGTFVVPQRLSAQPEGNKLQSARLHQSAQSYVRTKVPWEYTRTLKPPSEFNAGDKAGLLDNIDLSMSVRDFYDSKELETANESIKKIFSLQFASVTRRHNEIKWMNIRRLRKHVLDIGSFEAQVSALTFGIRHWQAHMKKKPRDVKKKVLLFHLIDRRRKFLCLLRKRDIYRFEWLIKELNIDYIPAIAYNPKETKKGWLREMTHKYCEGIRKSKLKAVREKLQAEQAAFLKEKEEKLKFMAEEVKALGLTGEELASVQYVDTAASQRGPPPVSAALQRIALASEGLADSPILPHLREPETII